MKKLTPELEQALEAVIRELPQAIDSQWQKPGRFALPIVLLISLKQAFLAADGEGDSHCEENHSSHDGVAEQPHHHPPHRVT